MKKLIGGVLSTLFKVDIKNKEVAEALLKSDGSDEFDEDKVLQYILDKDKDRISTIKAESSSKWDDAYKAAEKKVNSKLEKKLKDRFDIEEDLQGDDLLDKISDTLKESGAKTMTEDEIKKSSVFLKAERQWQKQLDDKDKEKEQALANKENEFSAKEILSSAKKSALELFTGLGEAILPADKLKADKMINALLLSELDNYQFQKSEDGSLLVLNKEGKRVEDDHGNAQSFKALIEGIAKNNFEFKASKDFKSPGNGGGNPPANEGAGKYGGKAPENASEYAKLLLDESIPLEQRTDIKSTYGEQFSKN